MSSCQRCTWSPGRGTVGVSCTEKGPGAPQYENVQGLDICCTLVADGWLRLELEYVVDADSEC